MKKLFFLATAILLLTLTNATATVSPVKPPLKASQILIPVGKTGATISLLELSRII